jgi:hypothetical protein
MRSPRRPSQQHDTARLAVEAVHEIEGRDRARAPGEPDERVHELLPAGWTSMPAGLSNATESIVLVDDGRELRRRRVGRDARESGSQPLARARSDDGLSVRPTESTAPFDTKRAIAAREYPSNRSER